MEAKHQSEVDFVLEIISHPIKIQKMGAKHQSEVDIFIEYLVWNFPGFLSN